MLTCPYMSVTQLSPLKADRSTNPSLSLVFCCFVSLSRSSTEPTTPHYKTKLHSHSPLQIAYVADISMRHVFCTWIFCIFGSAASWVRVLDKIKLPRQKGHLWPAIQCGQTYTYWNWIAWSHFWENLICPILWFLTLDLAFIEILIF